MQSLLRSWWLAVCISGAIALTVCVMGGLDGYTTPTAAVVQILLDGTLLVAIAGRWWAAEPGAAERRPLAYLLGAYCASVPFTAAYHLHATFHRSDTVYPTWVVLLWCGYLVLTCAFWWPMLWERLGSPQPHRVALRPFLVCIVAALVIAHSLHLQDLVAFKGIDAFRKGVYGLSGVLELGASITTVTGALVFRQQRWLQLLCLAQLALVQLDLVFCSVEFNNHGSFLAWPWETAWAFAQAVSCWIVITRFQDFGPFVRQGDVGTPPALLQGPIAGVLTGAAFLLSVFVYYVTTSNSWLERPELRGQGVALGILAFALLVVFVAPYLVFEDSSRRRAAAITVIGNFIMGHSIQNNSGVVNVNSTVGDISIEQRWTQIQKEVDLAALAAELSRLRAELKALGTDTSHDRAVAAVAEAEDAARSGDGPRALSYLKSAGVWALQVAEKIGVSLASSVLKSALGVA